MLDKVDVNISGMEDVEVHFIDQRDVLRKT